MRRVGSGDATLDLDSVRAERVAALDRPSMVPLSAYVERLRGRHGAVPWFDPFDGGVVAHVLVLLETPGSSLADPRFVSRDNATGTARNLRTAFGAAGLDRRDSVLWNAVPWVIHVAGARNRAPRAAEIAAGLALLPDLLVILGQVRVVVLAGRVARLAAPGVAIARPDLAVLTMPHPSPANVCTSPAVAPAMARTLEQARRIVEHRPQAPR